MPGAPPELPLPDFTVLSDERVPAAVAPSHRDADQHLLSAYDQGMLCIGSYGGGVLLRDDIVAPLLRQALADALTAMPWFAGSLVHRPGGRVDVSCTNLGARFVVATTSATLEQLQAGLAPAGGGGGPYVRTLADPWGAWQAPNSVDQAVKEQSALLCGFLLHLRGGGAALWVAVHHGLADFEALQTTAGHWAAAYNARLAGWEARTGGSAGAGAGGAEGVRPGGLKAVEPPAPATPPATPLEVAASAGGAAAAAAALQVSVAAAASAAAAAAAGAAPAAPRPAPGAQPPPRHPRHVHQQHWPPALPPDRARPQLDGAAVEAAYLDAGPPPPGLQPRDEYGLVGPFTGLVVVGYVLWHLVCRGGGVEGRTVHVPAAVLSGLKHRATRDLAEGAKRAAGAGGSGRDAVEWISTNDALVGRLLQVLHATPLRRPHALCCFVSADMRRRLTPPPPAGQGQMGNVVYSAHLEGLRPSEHTLGEVAAELRHALHRDLVPQFRGALRRAQEAVAAVGASRVVFKFLTEPDPARNIFSPTGPVNLTNWDVDYRLWQFGRSPPLAFTPLARLAPSVFKVWPAPPSLPGGGVLLQASMHAAVWRQLDAAGRDLLQLLAQGA